MNFQIGSTIGPYRIVRPLGKGGMGEVYEVEHVRLGVRMALKAFVLDGKDREFLRKRFFAEGRILARIRDRHIVHVVDLDVEPGSDTPYFVMNLVEGPAGAPRTLADESAAGGISEKRLLGWYGDIRAALATVHAAGIVHRDIKPENVLIDAAGGAVLTDFGVCRIVDESLRQQIAVTRTIAVDDTAARQAVLGTAAYLSPEVRAGGEPTAADDFYALGVMFFRLLTGVWYAPGTNVMDLLQPFDPAWRRIFAALLSVDLARREAPEVEPRRSSAPRRKSAWLGSAAAAILIGFAGFLLFYQKNRENDYLDDLFYIPAAAK